ncbi:MAG TPA: ATP synthase F1 subunit epsilon [Solirubrobacteraceae bacterium]|jgi:F-type H+-transporting ATPase subunit epsilon
MPHTTFRAEVLTPEGSVFDEDVQMVSTRTGLGSIGILARHQPTLGLLVPTELRLYRSDTDIVRYAQGEGYVQVSADGVLVLVEEAHEPGALDVADLREKLRKAEADFDAAEDRSEAQKRAARDKRRWAAFLRIAEGT